MKLWARSVAINHRKGIFFIYMEYICVHDQPTKKIPSAVIMFYGNLCIFSPSAKRRSRQRVHSLFNKENSAGNLGEREGVQGWGKHREAAGGLRTEKKVQAAGGTVFLAGWLNWGFTEVIWSRGRHSLDFAKLLTCQKANTDFRSRCLKLTLLRFSKQAVLQQSLLNLADMFSFVL